MGRVWPFAFGNLSFSGNETIDSFDPNNPGAGTKKGNIASVGNITFNGSQVIQGNVQAGGNVTFSGNSQTVEGGVYYGNLLSKGPSQYNEAKIKGEVKKSSLRTQTIAPSPVKPVQNGGFNNGNLKIRPLNGGGTTQNGVASGSNLSLSNSILTIPAPGVYHLSSFKNNNNSQLEIVGSGDVKIFVDGDFDLSAISTTNIKSAPGVNGSPQVSLIANAVKFNQYGTVNVLNTSQLGVFADKLTGDGSKTINFDATANGFFSAREVAFSGAAQINMAGPSWNNTPGKASNFVIYASEKATFSNGAKVAGLLYAPTATVLCSGGFDWWGAVIGKDITISGGPGVHIDEGLFTPSGGSGSYVTAWSEVAPKRI